MEPPPLEPPDEPDEPPDEPDEPPLGMLLDEPPEDPPPPLEPPEDPDDPPDEPPLGMLLEGIDEEEDCCWGQPPMRKADTELTSTHWTASVSRRLDVSDALGPVAVIRVG